MEKDRLTAFSDGVIAVIITIMVLDLKVPPESGWAGLWEEIPAFSTYVLSFLYVAIYWNNHHHLLQTARRVNGALLWANMHLLFWLSLFPWATAWTRQNYLAPLPTAFYGAILFLAAIAYYILQRAIIHAQDDGQPLLNKALGRDVKGKISPLLYAAAIGAAFRAPALSYAIYAAVAAMWLIPDRRIEKILA
jgi:uncharacterized membrane protein